MKLKKLLNGVAENNFKGNPETEISGIAYDSRLIKPGFLFAAIRGQTHDGHRFINEAVNSGAVALVVEDKNMNGYYNQEISIIQVPDSRSALSRLAVNYYDSPFVDMNLTGITGTNGKTSTSYLLESILIASGSKPGVLGTVNHRIPGKMWKATVTTPESLDLMKILRKMKDENVTDVVMEVSSHALEQGRVNDCPFGTAIFTNLSRDHLDYHQSMVEYFKAKSLLFQGLGKGVKDSTAIINTDDPMGKKLCRMTEAQIITYGTAKHCSVRVENINADRHGISATLITPMGNIDIRSSLIGDFNVYNILAASAAAISMGISKDAINKGIGRLREIPGRLEVVKNGRGIPIVVDYAHTPDALQKAMMVMKPLAEERLITVFGCGGNRDKGKRKQMGILAGKYSDIVFITSDNPRKEDPALIAKQIEEGVRKSGMSKLESMPADSKKTKGYIVILDRGEAIQSAIRIARNTDMVLIAGKGHEDYQIVGDEIRSFDDRKMAADAVSGLN